MAKLTAREREVVRLLATGVRPAEIAQRLCITRRTVYAHVRNSREKTGTSSALQLATQAARESVGAE